MCVQAKLEPCLKQLNQLKLDQCTMRSQDSLELSTPSTPRLFSSPTSQTANTEGCDNKVYYDISPCTALFMLRWPLCQTCTQCLWLCRRSTLSFVTGRKLKRVSHLIAPWGVTQRNTTTAIRHAHWLQEHLTARFRRHRHVRVQGRMHKRLHPHLNTRRQGYLSAHLNTRVQEHQIAKLNARRQLPPALRYSNAVLYNWMYVARHHA